MKKIAAIALALSLSILTYQQATASGPGWQRGMEATVTDPEAYQARQDFYNDTAELREELYEKRAQYFELLSSENIDKEQAGQLWSEIFDLQIQLKEKAQEAGFMGGFGAGSGAGRSGGGCAAGCGKATPFNNVSNGGAPCNEPECVNNQ